MPITPAGTNARMTALTRLRDGAASTGGVALGAVFRAAGALRPALKPLHPRGELVHGRLYRRGLEAAVGVPWLDEAGSDDVLVRFSRAVLCFKMNSRTAPSETDATTGFGPSSGSASV